MKTECRTGVQNGCLGGLCSVITGIGKRLRRSATLQWEANITCRTGVSRECGKGKRCPKWFGVVPSVSDGGLVRDPKWMVMLRHNRVRKTSRGARALHRNGSAHGVSRMRVRVSRMRVRVSRMREKAVQNGCLGGLCSVITGTGKRLRQSATLQGEANTLCRTGVSRECGKAGWCPKCKEREW